MVRDVLTRGLVLALAAAAMPAAAETLDINLGDDNLRATFQGPLDRVIPGTGGVYDAGLLFNRVKRGDDFVQGHAGLMIVGDAGARMANVKAGLGTRLVVLDAGPFSATALQLGAAFEVREPSINRFGLVGYLYAAPSVLSFGDADGVYEYALAVDYQIIREASVYVGYRQVKVDVDGGGTVTADTGWHGGIKLNF